MANHLDRLLGKYESARYIGLSILLIILTSCDHGNPNRTTATQIPNESTLSATSDTFQNTSSPSSLILDSKQIIIEPYPQYNILDTQYPKLSFNLLINPPHTQTEDFYVSASQSTILYIIWCAKTLEVMNNNFNHIQFMIDVEGEELNIKPLLSKDIEGLMEKGSECRGYIGLIRVWPPGKHVINITMHLDAQVNNGYQDFQAGDYINIKNIFVNYKQIVSP